MLRIDFGSTTGPFCDRVSRRQALRVGGSGLIAGLTLPRLLALRAEAPASTPARSQACIFLFLEGGPSTIDMWDLKPDAPSEIRGPYKPIPTTAPGISISEELPRCARIAHKFTILRSHSHNDNGHQTGYHYVMTGYRADFPDGSTRVPNNVLFPSIGSILSRELGPRGPLPPYINVPNLMTAGGPGFYGAEHAPFVIETDPVEPDFEVRDLRLPDGVSAGRLGSRRRLLARIEELARERDRRGTGGAGDGGAGDGGEAVGGPRGRSSAMSAYYEKAHDMITSPAALKAFDIRSEPEETRAAYGYTSLGQCALLARRLVEAGCRFIGVDHGSWDTHFDCFPSQSKDLFPHFDRAFSALVADLDRRGLLETTLVVAMGEMGRTPRINARRGRDHWSAAQSVIFAGGGTKPGRVVGATDRQAAYPVTTPVGVEDILRTVFELLGIDTTKTYYTPQGRPVPIVKGGTFIGELV